MRRGTLFVGLAVLTVGCGADQDIGRQYRAERDLWRTRQEASRLSIRPDLVSQDTWVGLAERFVAIGDEYGGETASDSPAAMAVRAIAARSLMSGAEVYAAIRDTASMMKIFARIASEYDDIAGISGEVALARGRVAEAKGEWEKAIRAYGRVLERVVPDSAATKETRDALLDLPLRMARLRVRDVSEPTPSQLEAAYAPARAYYEDIIQDRPRTETGLRAHSLLADVAADLGDWPRAVRELRILESYLLETENPPQDPAAVRYSTALLFAKGGGEVDSSRAVLLSLLEDYPESDSAPAALLSLAQSSVSEGRTEEALVYLDRVSEEYPDAERLGAQAMLAKGRLLDQSDRWREAHEVFRALPVQHPLSEPALQAPLDVVAHYTRVGDTVAVQRALEAAENEYREFLERYPTGSSTAFARQKLVQTLTLQKRYDEAIGEMVVLGETLAGTPQGAQVWITAARMAVVDLGDTTRAAEILDRTGALYARAEVGQWAAKEAARLREESEP